MTRLRGKLDSQSAVEKWNSPFSFTQAQQEAKDGEFNKVAASLHTFSLRILFRDQAFDVQQLL